MRVVAATNKDLVKAVRQGRFREGSYFRVAVLPLIVPPLRDRRAEVPLLVEHFLRRYGGDRSLVPSRELLRELELREWRGNIRLR